MSADDNDRALVVFVDSADPQQLARLKALVDARTGSGKTAPAQSPATYRGVPVPDRIRQDRDERGPYSALFAAWREGVDNALETTAPMLMAWADPRPCEINEPGECLTHDYPPPLCPDGEARRILREMGWTNQ